MSWTITTKTPMMTITDDDLRELFWRMGMSPAEIEVHLANSYAKAYTKVFLETLNRKIAERLAQGLIKQLFPEFNVN